MMHDDAETSWPNEGIVHTEKSLQEQVIVLTPVSFKPVNVQNKQRFCVRLGQTVNQSTSA